MGRTKLDYIVVVDIEATCWPGLQEQGTQPHEIIEIGLCHLNIATGERSNKESILIKPQFSTVSQYCTDLTTLTQEDVNQGVSLQQACEDLHKRYRKRVWASYGDYDRIQFDRECRSKGIKYPWSPKHINVKTLFALKHSLKNEIGMSRALDHINEELVGTHHRGADDAWNTALLLAKVVL